MSTAITTNLHAWVLNEVNAMTIEIFEMMQLECHNQNVYKDTS